MINKSFLDKLLKSGAELTNKTGQSGGGSLTELLKGKGGAALGGGALGLLLGSKKGRKVGGKILTYGGLAALGVLAYKAYGNWQQNNQTAENNTIRTIDRLPESEADLHSRAILIAVIAAAKADGHIDDREREIIDAEVAKLTADSELLRFVDNQLQKPLDPEDVARQAKTREMAAEMYLASVLVIDEESFMERSYLAELARQLQLPESLQAELKQQVKEAERLVQ